MAKKRKQTRKKTKRTTWEDTHIITLKRSLSKAAQLAIGLGAPNTYAVLLKAKLVLKCELAGKTDEAKFITEQQY